MDIRGLTVHEVWVEQASDIAAEYYAAVVFDRSAKKPLVMLSAAGGMEIEEVAEEKIARLHVDPLVGFLPFHGRRLAFESGIDADVDPARGRDAREALRRVRRDRRDAGRGQPADRDRRPPGRSPSTRR